LTIDLVIINQHAKGIG